MVHLAELNDERFLKARRRWRGILADCAASFNVSDEWDLWGKLRRYPQVSLADENGAVYAALNETREIAIKIFEVSWADGSDAPFLFPVVDDAFDGRLPTLHIRVCWTRSTGRLAREILRRWMDPGVPLKEAGAFVQGVAAASLALGRDE